MAPGTYCFAQVDNDTNGTFDVLGTFQLSDALLTHRVIECLLLQRSYTCSNQRKFSKFKVHKVIIDLVT
jgi:hypothetical protein